MALPEKFSEWEHLQDQVRRYHNKEVNKFFKNTNSENFSTPKEHLKHACLMKDEDTAEMTLLRKLLFEFDAGHAQSLHPVMIGMPLLDWVRETVYKPQIKLYFREIYSHEKHMVQALPQVRGEIGFRIMNRSAETISRADSVEYAREIKNKFVTSNLIWKKGHYKCTYINLENGYDLRLYVLNKQEGIDMARAVLSILDKAYSDDNFQFIENFKEFPANPGTHRIYGNTVKKWIRRPIADLKLTHAQLIIPGQIKPINLVSVGRRLKSSIEYA
jgi:hypothetical protein